jgi:tRNA (mo5U34)-methyltransferase
MDNPNVVRFKGLLSKLPEVITSHFSVENGVVTIGNPEELTDSQRALLENILLGLRPWRKGPFNLFGILIDSEWRADLKWERLLTYPSFIDLIRNRKVIDVGCSNGYYLFRMLEHQPSKLVGIDPSDLYTYQYKAITSLFNTPANLEFHQAVLSDQQGSYDTLLCMGVLYHRRSPVDALREMRDLLNPGGALVLETLIIEGEDDIALYPKDKYARMKNVHFLPTVSCLKNWLERAGFINSRVIDITETTLEEQRISAWSTPESLESFVVSGPDGNKTVEGYPPPIRAIVIAHIK